MGQVAQFFQPPLHWQQFEEITASVAGQVYETTLVSKFGRIGQAQNGVDVFVEQGRQGVVGIQCKRMDERDESNRPYPGGVITSSDLFAALAETDHFKTRLDLFVLATTAKRDAGIQIIADKISRDRASKGKSRVRLWFWDDYVTWLNNDEALQRWYYADVIRVDSAAALDRIILEVIGQAFDRPAFEHRLDHEHADDFLQALKDTERAVRTGVLLDRETRREVRKGMGGCGRLSDKALRAKGRQLLTALAALRGLLVEGLKDGRITAPARHLHFNDQALKRQMDKARADCLDEARTMLLAGGVRPPWA